MQNLYRVIANLPLPFVVWAFFASRDNSTAERPRRNGSYGWPR